ncbi:MAG: carboxylesterase family protein, partial [Acidimicrobiales bacterium]
MSTPIATVSTGQLEGRMVTVDDRAALAFGGVPYADAPVGPRRFALPRPARPWNGVRPCVERGAGAPQQVDDELVPDMTPARFTEDCLTAEVFTPALDGAHPVLVWVHGGAYSMGAAGLATYDGSRLAAEHDLVVVGLNYRLGALGFLSLDGAPTNLGLHDLIAGLEWTQREISAFGGDPERVTLMGESAGAGAIAHLLGAPRARGLFDGAILQSGAPTATLDAEQAGMVSEVFVEEVGTGDITELREIPVDAVVEAQTRTADRVLDRVGKMPFHPVIDGDLLPVAPLTAARAGDLAPVPLVIGTNSDEMALFRDQVPSLPDALIDLVLTPKLRAAT